MSILLVKCPLGFRHFISFYFLLIDFRERGREKEKEGEKHQSVASHRRPDQDQTHSPSQCPGTHGLSVYRMKFQPAESHWVTQGDRDFSPMHSDSLAILYLHGPNTSEGFPTPARTVYDLVEALPSGRISLAQGYLLFLEFRPL